LNDENFTPPCLIRQAKLSLTSNDPIRWVNLFHDPFLRIFRVFSIISGQGVFGVPQHAKNTRLLRFI
jgi:hypothetical protein